MYSISTYLATLGFLGGTILLFLQAEISASDTSWMTGMLPCTNRTPSTSPICRMPWLRLPPGLCRGGTGPWPWGGGDWRAAKILERCSWILDNCSLVLVWTALWDCSRRGDGGYAITLHKASPSTQKHTFDTKKTMSREHTPIDGNASARKIWSNQVCLILERGCVYY